MAEFQITNAGYPPMTLIPDDFINNYMPSANGDYVKIYLYLVYCVQKGQLLSVSGLADLFQCTENDIRRALKYWENKQLLCIMENECGDIIGLSFTERPSMNTSVPPVLPAVPAQDTEIPKKHSYTAEETKSFQTQSEIKQLLFVCEQYIGKQLTRTDLETLLYFYDQLHFSADLIEYLVEYSVSKNKRSLRYMEAVALEWHKKGIRTVEAAKLDSKPYARECYLVLKALGINNHDPLPLEAEHVNRWMNDYGFTIDIILEACNRTIMQIHKPSFEYTDGILKAWKNAGVHHFADINRLEAARKTHAAAKTPVKNNQTFTTRFHNFEQHRYDSKELDKFFVNQ